MEKGEKFLFDGEEIELAVPWAFSLSITFSLYKVILKNKIIF